MNNEIPDLINDRNMTKHLSFVTENLRANMDGRIKDTKLNFQLIKTYNRIVQLNSRLSFIDSPVVYLDNDYNRSFAWNDTKRTLGDGVKDLQKLRYYAVGYNSTIETC